MNALNTEEMSDGKKTKRAGRSRGRSRGWPMVLGVVIVFVAGGVGWGLWGRGNAEVVGAADPANGNPANGGAAAAASAKSATGDGWHRVGRESFELVIRSSGELRAKRQVEVKSRVTARPVIISVVDEGSMVKAGDLLVKLDDEEIKKQIEQELLNTEQARSGKIAAEQELSIKENEAESQLKAAEVKLSLAQLELAKWKNGTDPQRVADLAVELKTAERRLTTAERELKFSHQLYAEDFISQGELESDESDLIDAKNKLAKAKLNKVVYDLYERPKELKQRTSDLEQAAASLERTLRKNEQNLSRAKDKLASKINSLNIRLRILDEARDQLVKTQIKAPQDGVVVYASSVGPEWRRGRDPIAPGRQVRFNETVVVLPDTGQMVSLLRVHEALVSKVKVGQEVRVTIDARADELPVKGVVNKIGVTAQDGGWLNRDLREYEVYVDLPEGLDDSLKPAMRCSGEITIGKVEERIAVPIQSVFTEGDKRFCYVPAGIGKVRVREVEIGRSNERFVEIVNGLEERDYVLLRRPKAGEIRG